MSIYDAAMKYIAAGVPTVVFAGEEYGTGSSRATGRPRARSCSASRPSSRKSFERIHRSNLVGMGVLPLQFKGGDSWQSWACAATSIVDAAPMRCRRRATPRSSSRRPTARRRVTVTLRIDTPIEVDYYRHGGILPDEAGLREQHGARDARVVDRGARCVVQAAPGRSLRLTSASTPTAAIQASSRSAGRPSRLKSWKSYARPCAVSQARAFFTVSQFADAVDDDTAGRHSAHPAVAAECRRDRTADRCPRCR